MKKSDDMEEPQSTLMKVAGAVADSFARRESERLCQLEKRLRWLSKLSSYLLLAAMAYWAYQFWIEIRPELNGAFALPAPVDNDETRGSSYLLLAMMLGVPVMLFVGYVALGVFYNLTVATLTNLIPLLRFAILPLLIWSMLNALEIWRDEVKSGVIDGYAMVRGHVDSAMSLKAHFAGAKDRAREQANSQFDVLPSPEGEGSQ